MNAEGITQGDIRELKESLQVGDILTCEILVKIREDERILVPVKAAVRVAAKYPQLVRVEAAGKGPLPIRTMTYVEILIQGSVQEEEHADGTKGRMRRRRGEIPCSINLENLIPMRN